MLTLINSISELEEFLEGEDGLVVKKLIRKLQSYAYNGDLIAYDDDYETFLRVYVTNKMAYRVNVISITDGIIDEIYDPAFNKGKIKTQLANQIEDLDETDFYDTESLMVWKSIFGDSMQGAFDGFVKNSKYNKDLDYKIEGNTAKVFVLTEASYNTVDQFLRKAPKKFKIEVHTDSKFAETLDNLDKFFEYEHFYRNVTCYVDSMPIQEFLEENIVKYCFDVKSLKNISIEDYFEAANIEVLEKGDTHYLDVPVMTYNICSTISSIYNKGAQYEAIISDKKLVLNVGEWDWGGHDDFKAPYGIVDINSLPNASNFRESFANRKYFNPSSPLKLPKTCKCAAYMFADCTELNQKVIINEGCEEIYYMFWGCTKFNQQITIPDSVRRANNCLMGCKSLTKKPIVECDLDADESGFKTTGGPRITNL